MVRLLSLRLAGRRHRRQVLHPVRRDRPATSSPCWPSPPASRSARSARWSSAGSATWSAASTPSWSRSASWACRPSSSACCPPPTSIGLAAPAILIGLRLLQGLALGGEYGGAATYVAEHAPHGRRGFYTSWIQTTATLGLFLSLLVILFTRTWLGEEAFADWGWRVPFLVSIILLGDLGLDPAAAAGSRRPSCG